MLYLVDKVAKPYLRSHLASGIVARIRSFSLILSLSHPCLSVLSVV